MTAMVLEDTPGDDTWIHRLLGPVQIIKTLNPRYPR